VTRSKRVCESKRPRRGAKVCENKRTLREGSLALETHRRLLTTRARTNRELEQAAARIGKRYTRSMQD
jgi:hypothetical protein